MAGDIRGLLDAVGVQRVHIVARDIGLMVGYALAAQWPERVASMTMLDVPLPGTGAWEQAKGDPQTWHFGLHRQRDVAETLVTGREYDYISTFYRARTQVAGAVTDDDLAVYARAYGAPGALRAGFELYRAFDEDEERFAELMEDKLPMPVLAFGGELDTGATIPDMAREVAADVRAVIVPGGGHWTPEENPGFLLERLLAFLPPPGPRQRDTGSDHEQWHGHRPGRSAAAPAHGCPPGAHRGRAAPVPRRCRPGRVRTASPWRRPRRPRRRWPWRADRARRRGSSPASRGNRPCPGVRTPRQKNGSMVSAPSTENRQPVEACAASCPPKRLPSWEA